MGSCVEELLLDGMKELFGRSFRPPKINRFSTASTFRPWGALLSLEYGLFGSPAGVKGREYGDCVPETVPGVPGLGVPIGLPSLEGGNESPVAPIP